MANNKDLKEKKQKSRYFKDMKAELKKVVWPTSKQTINNTVAVVVFTVVIALIVFVLDLCFDSIHKYGITPLQEKVQSSYKNLHEVESENLEEDNNEESEASESDSTDINIDANNETENSENDTSESEEVDEE